MTDCFEVRYNDPLRYAGGLMDSFRVGDGMNYTSSSNCTSAVLAGKYQGLSRLKIEQPLEQTPVQYSKSLLFKK